MARTNNKRFFKDRWRFGKSDPNQFGFPLNEDWHVFRNDDGDDVRIALAKWWHYVDQHSTKYDSATYHELAKMFAARSKSEIAAEYKRGTSFVEAKPFVRIFNWIRRTGFSVA